MPRKWIGTVLLGLAMTMPTLADDTVEKSAISTEAAKRAAKKDAPRGDETPSGGRASAQEGPAMELEIQQLKESILKQSRELEAQRQKMEALEEELDTVRDKSTAATSAKPGSSPVSLEAVAHNQEELGTKVGKLETELDSTKKSVEGRIKGFGPFSFSGDLRVRFEPFFGGGPQTSPVNPDRFRERFRLRLNANARFNDEFSGGFSLASGDLNNPLSTNQTFATFYIRKPIAIDRAFVTYGPTWYKPFSVTAGKFAYTWYRTELAWDNDLNPEGISESLHWNWKDSFLQHLGLVAFQLPFNSTVSGPVVPAGFTIGGQVQVNFKLQQRLRFGAYAAYYNYRNTDQIAQNQVGSGPGVTAGVLGGNNITNFFGVIGTTRFFASKFGVLDTIAKLDVDTGIGRFPLMLLFNFAQNTRACENRSVFTAASVTPPFCNPRERHAYWSEVQLGRTQEQGDVRFGYTFMRIERDSVPSAFNFDDKRQATNVAQHRIEVFYQAYKNITFGFTGLIGRQLVDATSPTTTVTPERWLKRLQFDLIYKF